MALNATPGDPVADAYGTMAEANAYHLALGREASWVDLDSEETEPAMRRATLYMDAHYNWRGLKATEAQALGWPRTGVTLDGFVVDATSIPVAVKRACFELAFRALTEELMGDVPAQHAVSVKVGPIERKLSDPTNSGQKRFAYVDVTLKRLVMPAAGVPVVRS